MVLEQGVVERVDREPQLLSDQSRDRHESHRTMCIAQLGRGRCKDFQGVDDTGLVAEFAADLEALDEPPSRFLEAALASASELQNKGNGNYQLNWKTDKGWTGCKQMRLSLG
jgi:hypothetical protein